DGDMLPRQPVRKFHGKNSFTEPVESKMTNSERWQSSTGALVDKGWRYFWSRPHRINMPHNPCRMGRVPDNERLKELMEATVVTVDE
ncbi:MAG: hypothetical protein ACXABY_30410, partial [Candidatus Thorarchaeota archaeon]